MQQCISAKEQTFKQHGSAKSTNRKTGLSNLIQSGSGTGTYEIDWDIKSVTEVQLGSYTVMDKQYYDIDKTIIFKAAMTLLTTVVSANTKKLCVAKYNK